MFKRRRRKTEWLFGARQLFTGVFSPSEQFATLPLLPADVIALEHNGTCVVQRIIADFNVYCWSDAAPTGADGTWALTAGILKVQLDDTSVFPQLQADPFGTPGLVSSPGELGAQRQFAWSKPFLFATDLYNSSLGAASRWVYQPVNANTGIARSESNYDIKRKVRIRDGEALAWQWRADAIPAGLTTLNWTVDYLWRVLVSK